MVMCWYLLFDGERLFTLSVTETASRIEVELWDCGKHCGLSYEIRSDGKESACIDLTFTAIYPESDKEIEAVLNELQSIIENSIVVAEIEGDV